MTEKSVTLSQRSLWILGPKRDLGFFILTPFFIIPLIFFLKRRIPLETLGIYVLGLGGFGHHLPGFIRAYSDPDLFKRFKLRFTLIPAVLLLVCGLYSFLDLNALTCATVAWGTWHGAMQINGFMRIYDSKVKSFSPVTARLDWSMCLAWFGLAILHSPAKQFSIIAQFYASGGFLISPVAFTLLRQFWDASTILITLLFLANTFRQWQSGSPPSPVKLLTLVSSFTFWWYCVVTLNNLVLGVVMWEIFHDVQYDVLVWLFQRHRVDKNMNIGRIEKILFTPGWERLVLYLLVILGYGYIGVISSFGDINLPEKLMLGNGASQWLLRITVASAMLHFYYDGFIWRIREKSIRQGLGVQEGNIQTVNTPRMSFAQHGWKWAFFIVPVTYLGLSQYNAWSATPDSQMLNLTKTIPHSWLPHFMTGIFYSEHAHPDSAEAQYRLAVKYKPDFAIGYLFLGDLSAKEEKLQEALEYYLKSVALDSNLLESRSHLASLYLKLSQPSAAGAQYQAALGMQPESPDLNFGMGSALLMQHRFGDAKPYLEKTLKLDPNHSGALNYLGIVQELGGDLSGAISYYQKALASNPNNQSARENLAAALAKLSPSAGLKQP